MNVILADRQDITRAGLMYVVKEMDSLTYECAEDKAGLLELLKVHPDSLVVLDYTLFDINDVDELLIIGQRFSKATLLLFCEDLSVDFLRIVVAASKLISVVLKESSLAEIKAAIQYAACGQRFICQRVTELLLAPSQEKREPVNLTKTEREILVDIALGMTTKEIAEKRFSSFHTVNTHRKNIFRKLGVNNVHEATKYALRAGLVDSAEYYI